MRKRKTEKVRVRSLAPKRGAALLLCCILVLGALLSGCSSGGAGQPGGSGGTDQPGSSGGAGQPGGLGGTSEPGGGAGTQDTVEKYLEIKRMEEYKDSLEIPHIKEDVLSSDDVKAANALFASIEEAMKKEAEERRDDMGVMVETMVETKAALNDNVLSIQVWYGSGYVKDGTIVPQRFCETVNIDVTTGKTVPYERLLELSGFSASDVEESLACYVELVGDNYVLSRLYFDAGWAGTLVTGPSSPPDWQDAMDEAVREFKATLEVNAVRYPKESSAKAGTYPTAFYCGKGRLAVCGLVPGIDGAMSKYAPVNVGRDDDEIRFLNPNDCDGFSMVSNCIMSPGGAVEAAAKQFKVGADGRTPEGTPMMFAVVGMENVRPGNDAFEPCYVIHAIVYPGEVGLEENLFAAVGVFSGIVHVKTTAAEEWNVVMESREAAKVTAAAAAPAAKESVLTVYGAADDFEIWASNPYSRIDLTSQAQDWGDPADVENFVIYVAEDTKLSFVDGSMEGSKFKVESVYIPLEVPKGQWVHVRCMRPAQGARQAISAENKLGKCIYPIGSDRKEGVTEYLADGKGIS